MPGSPAFLAAPPSAAARAASALASRRWEPAIRGRIMVEHSKTAQPSAPATPHVATAPLANPPRPCLDPDVGKSLPPSLRAFDAGGGEFASGGLSEHLPVGMSSVQNSYGLQPELVLASQSLVAPAPPPTILAAGPQPVLWASAADDDEDDEEELAPQTPVAAIRRKSDAAIAVILESPRLFAAPKTIDAAVPGSVQGTVDVCHVEKAPARPCGDHSAVAATFGDEVDWVQVDRRGRPDCESSCLLRKEALERSLAFKRWARGRCFRCLERGHQVRTCRQPFKCIRCRRPGPGHRERFCRARSPAARSRSPDTRAACQRSRSSDARAPYQRSRSPSAQPCRPSLSRSWAEVVRHSSLRSMEPPRPSDGCCEEFNINTSLNSVFQSQLALLRMEMLQLVADRIEEASRPLREEVATLKLLLARVSDSLEPTKACTSSGLGPAPAQASFLLDPTEQKLSVAEEGVHYGCFSSRGSPCPSPHHVTLASSQSEFVDGILTPVTPELKEELCGESSVVLSLELGSLEAMVVPTSSSPPQTESCQSLTAVDRGGELAPSSEALFAKELCNLLASLQAASPGYGKDIDCVLAGKASEDVIRKVEKFLLKVTIRGKRRKRGVARKASAAD